MPVPTFVRPLLVALLVFCPAAAQWSSDPAANLSIVTQSGEQVVSRVAATPDGSTWVAWFDDSGSSYAVRAQRLDAAGNAQFAEAGLLVSDHPQSSSLVDWDLISDPAGNAVLVPAPGVIISGLPTGPAGALTLSGAWPAGLPVGTPLVFQFWIVDAAALLGLSASNGVQVLAG